jgi:hypothetical protein
VLGAGQSDAGSEALPLHCRLEGAQGAEATPLQTVSQQGNALGQELGPTAGLAAPAAWRSTQPSWAHLGMSWDWR